MATGVSVVPSLDLVCLDSKKPRWVKEVMWISPFPHSEYDVGSPMRGSILPNPVTGDDYVVPSS